MLHRQDDLILKRILYKLFHIEESIEHNTREIRARGKGVLGLRQEQEAQDAALEATRAEQARARSAAMKEEKRIKKMEKALEAKVSNPVVGTEMTARIANDVS
jgi:structural maintenance of chromosome 1